MKKPMHKRWYVWLAAFILIGGMANAFGGGEEKDVEPPIVKAEEDMSTLEERISDIIYKVIGKEEDKEDSIISLSVVSGNVRAVMRKIPLSERVYKTQLLIDSKKILEKLSELEEIEYINLEWQGKFTDQYGNSEWSPVMRVSMERETLDKINWKDFDKNNIENVADDYWQHKVLD